MSINPLPPPPGGGPWKIPGGSPPKGWRPFAPGRHDSVRGAPRPWEEKRGEPMGAQARRPGPRRGPNPSGVGAASGVAPQVRWERGSAELFLRWHLMGGLRTPTTPRAVAGAESSCGRRVAERRATAYGGSSPPRNWPREGGGWGMRAVGSNTRMQTSRSTFHSQTVSKPRCFVIIAHNSNSYIV